MNLLLVVLFLPLAGFLAALAVPRSSPAGQPRLGARGLARDVRRCRSACWPGSTAAWPASSSRIDVPWIPSPDIHFAICRQRRQPLADPALHLPDAHLRPDFLALHPEPREGVLRLPAAARIRPGRRLPRAGPVPVLRVLGSLPGPDVLPDRHLGPRAPHLRRRQVLPLHHGRLGADAGRHHLPLQPHPDVQLPRHPRRCSPAAGWSSRRASRCCCSWPSSSPSPSRCRSSRCTPGCPTRTWRRPRPAP